MKITSLITVILGILLITGIAPISLAQEPIALPASQIPSLDIETLRSEIESSITKVPEFQAIREMAGSLGIRCYLFGGTSAAFSHYVKWNTLRLQGHTQFVDPRFDFDFTNIFLSTQDIDLVVDGSAEQARTLEDQLKSRFPYFQGSKSQWEVRTLRVPIGNKTPLLNDYDFLNQHTDSHSTGLIEVTEGYQQDSTSVVRDIRDWDNQSDPDFLRDVAEGKLNYYFSSRHNTTSRFKKGENPPIFSVIRYLTKAFQFGLEMRQEDLSIIRGIIDEFNPRTGLATDYARAWLEEKGYGSKLIRSAMDVEYAWNILEEFGLRKKLIALNNDPKTEGSLAWWISKEPLRTKPVGLGRGRTIQQAAESMGIPWKEFVIAHETCNYTVYEAITRDVTGRLNVLISRNNDIPGEYAFYGNGFYNMIGRIGARGTGLTIRSRMNQEAREGSDFALYGDMIILLNKAAATYIPESLNLDVPGYFRILKESKLDSSDKGILEQLRRRIHNRIQNDLSQVTAEEFKEIQEIVLESLESFKNYQGEPLPEVIGEFINSSLGKKDPSVEHILTNGLNNTIQNAIKSQNLKKLQDLAYYTFNYPYSKNWGEQLISLIDAAITLEDSGTLAKLSMFAFSQPHSINWEIQLSNLITGAIWLRNDVILMQLAEYTFSQPHSINWGTQLSEMIKGTTTLYSTTHSLSTLAEYTFSQPHSKDWGIQLSELIKIAIRFQDTNTLHRLAIKTFSKPHSKDWGTQLSMLIEGAVSLGDKWTLQQLAYYIFSQPHSKHWEEQLIRLIEGAIQIGDREILSQLSLSFQKQKNELSKKFARLNNKLLGVTKTNFIIELITPQAWSYDYKWKNAGRLVENFKNQKTAVTGNCMELFL